MILVGGPGFNRRKYRGWGTDIDDDRRVELLVDENNTYAIKMKNGQRVKELAFSQEAAAALLDLLLHAASLPPLKEGGDE